MNGLELEALEVPVRSLTINGERLGRFDVKETWRNFERWYSVNAGELIVMRDSADLVENVFARFGRINSPTKRSVSLVAATPALLERIRCLVDVPDARADEGPADIWLSPDDGSPLIDRTCFNEHLDKIYWNGNEWLYSESNSPAPAPEKFAYFAELEALVRPAGAES
ncbi:MAG: hypothetical protein AAGI72_23525 [Pseudomonadota bacterium]